MKYLLLAFCFCSVPLLAQEAQDEVMKLAYSNPFNQANQDAINMWNRAAEMEEISVMKFPTWQPLECLGRDSTWLYLDSANYHIDQDKIFFISEGKYYALFPERVFYAKLGEAVFIHRPYSPEKKRTINHYFEVLTAGDYSLLCKHEIRRQDKNDHPMGLPATRYTEVTKEKEYYYIRENGRVPESVPRKRKDFIFIFRKFRPEMVIYAKEQRISLRDEEDLKSIFAYYNRLVAESTQ